MVERDLTAGELGIKLDGVSDQLKQIRSEMFTTALFAAWRDGNEARLVRLEDDQKEWARISTQAHEQLAGQITAALANDKAEREKLKVSVNADIARVAADLAGLKEDQETIKEKQEARRYDLVKSISLAVLVSLLGVISTLAVVVIRNGGL